MDSQTSDGWRIALVPTGANPDGPTRPWWMPKAAGVLVVTFLIGIVMVMADQSSTSYLPGIVLCGSMFGILAIAGIRGLQLKRVRAGWVKVAARCIDHEFQLVPLRNGNAGGFSGWVGRMVCEFDLAGKHYRTTPAVCWSNLRGREYDFPSERKAERFFEKHVTVGGACQLRVNPANPLEGMLA